MKLSRNITNIIHFILDNLVPPFIRDTKWFMWIPFKIVFKDKQSVFFTFKDDFVNLTDKQIIEIYKDTKRVHLTRETDINTGCIDRILSEVVGTRVLDLGCGTGYLSNLIEKTHKVTSLDFIKPRGFKAENESTMFIEADVTAMPFGDNSFDTVICAHTLEHVRDINKAIIELQRVCKNKLIIVVPKQRPFKYTFDLHIHFFPYEFVFLNLMASFGKGNIQRKITSIQGDIYYQEQYNEENE
jgi:ubiquinone/menaquinone biosynthesis C-methylase UbiE